MSLLDIQDYTFSRISNQVTLWLEYKPYQTVGIVYVQFKAKDTGEILGTQSVNIPEDVYSSWTTSDDTLVYYVLNELGITLAS